MQTNYLYIYLQFEATDDIMFRLCNHQTTEDVRQFVMGRRIISRQFRQMFPRWDRAERIALIDQNWAYVASYVQKKKKEKKQINTQKPLLLETSKPSVMHLSWRSECLTLLYLRFIGFKLKNKKKKKNRAIQAIM